MRAGLLTETVSIYSQSIVQNEFGQTSKSWVKVYDTRARVIQDKGIRTTQNYEILHEYDVAFVVRSYVPVSDTDAIEWKNKKYRIISVIEDKKENSLTIKTKLLNE